MALALQLRYKTHFLEAI